MQVKSAKPGPDLDSRPRAGITVTPVGDAFSGVCVEERSDRSKDDGQTLSDF
jgi:hypothetical protein